MPVIQIQLDIQDDNFIKEEMKTRNLQSKADTIKIILKEYINKKYK